MHSAVSDYAQNVNLESLKAIIGPNVIEEDQDIISGATSDWTRRYQGHSTALALPTSTSEVAEILKWCSSNRISVVPQGGNTGMVGGGVPMNGELILSLKKMTKIEFVDGAPAQLIADAGATLSTVQREAAKNGWVYGVDFSARESATIGGTIATNAGGNHVIRYGDTRKQLISVEAVTAEGIIVGDIRGLVKDNTGYHLPSFLCGSEGTLAVITRARLGLWAKPEEKVVVLVGLESVEEALDIARLFASTNQDMQASEIFFRNGLALVCNRFEIKPPWGGKHSTYLLLEFAGPKGVLERIQASNHGQILQNTESVAIGEDEASRSRLWRYRSLHTEAISGVGIPHKLDVTVPHHQLPYFMNTVGSIVEGCASDSETYLFGHAGDGNIHVNVIGPNENDLTIDKAVLEFVSSLGGSISAEHGIGRAKAAYLHLRRTPEEIRLFKDLKNVFDPIGILNPGVIFFE